MIEQIRLLITETHQNKGFEYDISNAAEWKIFGKMNHSILSLWLKNILGIDILNINHQCLQDILVTVQQTVTISYHNVLFFFVKYSLSNA